MFLSILLLQEYIRVVWKYTLSLNFLYFFFQIGRSYYHGINVVLQELKINLLNNNFFFFQININYKDQIDLINFFFCSFARNK
jgi:hypothetical protein